MGGSSEYNRLYHLAHREEILERHRWYRKKNQEAIRTYARQHYYDRLDYYRAQSKKYAKEHPERMVDLVARRRARQYHNGKYEVIDRRRVYIRDGGICWICEIEVQDKWEIDHKIPLSKGGTHTYDNVGVAHRSCNARKATKILDPEGVKPMPIEPIMVTAA